MSGELDRKNAMVNLVLGLSEIVLTIGSLVRKKHGPACHAVIVKRFNGGSGQVSPSLCDCGLVKFDSLLTSVRRLHEVILRDLDISDVEAAIRVSDDAQSHM